MGSGHLALLHFSTLPYTLDCVWNTRAVQTNSVLYLFPSHYCDLSACARRSAFHDALRAASFRFVMVKTRQIGIFARVCTLRACAACECVIIWRLKTSKNPLNCVCLWIYTWWGISALWWFWCAEPFRSNALEENSAYRGNAPRDGNLWQSVCVCVAQVATTLVLGHQPH